MLVLSRRENESLIIADNIVVTVLDCGQGQVRIGIEAPREINIVRAELLDRESDRSYRGWFTKSK